MTDVLDDKTKAKVIKQLKEERERKDLSQAEVAKKAGINKNYFARLERGEENPSTDTILKIAKALDLKSSDILPF